MTETKHEKFLRLSAARMEKVEFAMKQLTYLNSHNYEFEAEDASSIVERLKHQVEQVSTALGVVTVSEPEPEPEAPFTPWQAGPMELMDHEGRYLVQVGNQLGAAINALEDNQPDQAKMLLLNLMRS